jgi:hypothetical protein
LLRNARAATAAALIGSLALASAAEAVPARGTGKPASANYKLNMVIEQNTDWKYVKQKRPTCDWPETGEGTQEISVFALDQGARVRVTGKKVRVLKPKPVFNRAVAKVVTEWDRKFSQISPCTGGDSNGGDGKNEDATGKDECITSGEVHLRVGNSRGQVYPTPGDPHRPKGEVKKGYLVVRADPAWQDKSADSYQSLPGKCSAEGHPYAQLGLTDTRGEYNGGIIEVTRKLPLKKLLSPKTRKWRITAKRTLSYPNAIQKEQPQVKTTGTTKVEVRFIFRRIK